MEKDKKSERGQDPNVRGEVPFCLMAHYDNIFWRKKNPALQNKRRTDRPTNGRTEKLS